MSRTYNEGTSDAQKEDDYDGLAAYLDRAHMLREHDDAAVWGQGERHFIPRQDGTGETVTISSVTPSYVHFTTDDGTKAAISRGLLATLLGEMRGRDEGATSG